jgi:hypothetical protein
MYLVDHPAAIQTPPNVYDSVNYNLSTIRKKWKNKREQYLKLNKLHVLSRYKTVLKVSEVRGNQEGLFKLVMLNFIFKWYNWSNFRLLTASH